MNDGDKERLRILANTLGVVLEMQVQQQEIMGMLIKSMAGMSPALGHTFAAALRSASVLGQVEDPAARQTLIDAIISSFSGAGESDLFAVPIARLETQLDTLAAHAIGLRDSLKTLFD